ncbi:hypothetical protein MY11210_000515 [Beauveria gryllotalpidicola]
MPGRSTTPIDSCNTSSKKSGRIATDIPTLPFADAQAFRRYIINVGVAAPGVWLKIAKKSTMIPTVTYDAAIDEALCCRLDRRPAAPARTRGSTWSQRNVDKVAALAAAGRMLPAGLAEVDAAKADGRWEKAVRGVLDHRGAGRFSPRCWTLGRERPRCLTS